MRILITLLFVTSTLDFAYASIDRTRLQMELNYLLDDSREQDPMEETTSKMTSAKEKTSISNLKFTRNANKNSPILPLEDEFDKVEIKYSAPNRTIHDSKQDKFTPSEKVSKPVKMNGLVPKSLFEEEENK